MELKVSRILSVEYIGEVLLTLKIRKPGMYDRIMGMLEINDVLGILASFQIRAALWSMGWSVEALLNYIGIDECNRILSEQFRNTVGPCTFYDTNFDVVDLRNITHGNIYFNGCIIDTVYVVDVALIHNKWDYGQIHDLYIPTKYKDTKTIDELLGLSVTIRKIHYFKD